MVHQNSTAITGLKTGLATMLPHDLIATDREVMCLYMSVYVSVCLCV